MDECTSPRVIITDRDLALMKSSTKVFPDSMKLLCKWHIGKNVVSNYKKLFHDKESWDAFYSLWHMLVDSEIETEYVYNLSTIESHFQCYPTAINYIHDVWLTQYKEMFISVWTDKDMHFGNRTSNRAESQHEKLKRYLGTSQLDIESTWESIHQLLEAQFTAIKASLEKSKNIVQHIFKPAYFRELRGFVSADALQKILEELDRSKVVGVDVHNCGCKLRLTHGLPCAHELAVYVQEVCPVPLTCIDNFWKKLDLLPSATLEDNDDISCSIELQMFTEQFEKKSKTGKVSLLRKLREIINPSITALVEPKVMANTHERPSSKKKIDTSTHHNPSAFEYVDNEFIQSQEPGRHNCSSIHIPPSIPNQRHSRPIKANQQQLYIG